MNINVLLTLSDSYIPYAAVTMASIYEHNPQKNRIDIYLICPGVTEKHKTQIEGLGGKYGQTVYWCDLDERQLDRIRKCHGGSSSWHESVLYRLFAAECLPQSLDKVLYMDCDAIAVADLALCYNADIQNVSGG